MGQSNPVEVNRLWRKPDRCLPETDKEAAIQVVRTLLRGGWSLSTVANGVGEYPVDIFNVLSTLFVTDDCLLYVTKGCDSGFVTFVWGNDPAEAMNDWTTNLSPWLDPLEDTWIEIGG